jgi:hypothetical protein
MGDERCDLDGLVHGRHLCRTFIREEQTMGGSRGRGVRNCRARSTNEFDSHPAARSRSRAALEKLADIYHGGISRGRLSHLV